MNNDLSEAVNWIICTKRGWGTTHVRFLMMASASRLWVGLEAGDRDVGRVEELGETHTSVTLA